MRSMPAATTCVVWDDPVRVPASLSAQPPHITVAHPCLQPVPSPWFADLRPRCWCGCYHCCPRGCWGQQWSGQCSWCRYERSGLLSASPIGCTDHRDRLVTITITITSCESRPCNFCCHTLHCWCACMHFPVFTALGVTPCQQLVCVVIPCCRPAACRLHRASALAPHSCMNRYVMQSAVSKLSLPRSTCLTHVIRCQTQCYGLPCMLAGPAAGFRLEVPQLP